MLNAGSLPTALKKNPISELKSGPTLGRDTIRRGAYAIGLSGYSDTLTSFAGGPPQVAIHGTNQPQLLGTAASHGCVRVANDAIVEIAGLVGLGTPVYIQASRGDAAD